LYIPKQASDFKEDESKKVPYSEMSRVKGIIDKCFNKLTSVNYIMFQDMISKNESSGFFLLVLYSTAVSYYT
jgi:hypothetical protein